MIVRRKPAWRAYSLQGLWSADAACTRSRLLRGARGIEEDRHARSL